MASGPGRRAPGGVRLPVGPRGPSRWWPPCQPFSLGGVARGDEDKRNMFPEMFRAIRQIQQPRAVICENVRGTCVHPSGPGPHEDFQDPAGLPGVPPAHWPTPLPASLISQHHRRRLSADPLPGRFHRVTRRPLVHERQQSGEARAEAEQVGARAV
ncbi:DNA cytosine methyltransferase [Micromonospora inyonensis]|uniref:DNA cytosine methyltransferase n=1 Tax=Micromonospora inyonensis TaxID=47866 RepID=UPI003CCB985A